MFGSIDAAPHIFYNEFIMMGMKRILAAVFLPLLLAAFLFPQSLTELSKKEKERREKIKGKKTVVVTNADLVKVKKKPAVEILEPLFPEEEQITEQSVVTKEAPSEEPQPEITEKVVQEVDTSSLEEKWKKANEYVSLLNLRMTGLWQQFYSLDEMASRDAVQKEISTTYLALQQAQQEADKLKEELDKAQIQKKE